MSKAPRKISRIPTKYITGPTQDEPAKNAPANNAITGILAPQGMNVVSIAVALLSLSSRIVRLAMIPGIPHPVPMMIGMMDLPDRPTRLKIGSITTLTRAMYPQSSRSAIRKYITITSGRKPTTAPTPPTIPSARIACSSGDPPSSSPDTYPWNVSIQPTSQSAIHGPTLDWETQNTAHITTANITIPTNLFVITASILSCLFLSFVCTSRCSTSLTILFTNAKRFLSSASTASLSCRLISACI